MAWGNMPDLFADMLKKELNRVYRGFAITCLRNIVARSPVNSGRYRGSHILTIANPSYQVGQFEDKVGAQTLQAGITTLNGVPVGQFPPIFIQTNLPYALRIENGWSQQAAQGVYAVSFHNAIQAYR